MFQCCTDFASDVCGRHSTLTPNLSNMNISEIWRYPVKSMGGERLTQTHLAKGGVPYDLGWTVRDESDKTIRGAKHFGALMSCSARYLLDAPAVSVPKAEITLPDEMGA